MKEVRPHYFESIDYDSIHDFVHGYTVVIDETLRLDRMELFELNEALSDQIDTEAMKQARDEYNDRKRS